MENAVPRKRMRKQCPRKAPKGSVKEESPSSVEMDAVELALPCERPALMEVNRPLVEVIAKQRRSEKTLQKTPLRPIDRRQVPKTPLKSKKKQDEVALLEGETDAEVKNGNATSNGKSTKYDLQHNSTCLQLVMRKKVAQRKSASTTNGSSSSALSGVSSSSDSLMSFEKKDEDFENINTGCQAAVIHIKLAKVEEQLIHTRAETYINSIQPDPNFYDIEGGRKIYFMTKMCSKQLYQQTPDSHREKKKRKSYDNMECYVSHFSREAETSECPLPEGTKLAKPPSKLVELVARSIFESPDAMLQVQQVYVALQNRYPYFRFMHKSAINSWKSSIRHALYQKWFYKVKVASGLHSDGKGCYWALNTNFTPREWSMPRRGVVPSIAFDSRPIDGQKATSIDCIHPPKKEASKVPLIKTELENTAPTATPKGHEAAVVGPRPGRNDRDPDPLLPSATFRKAKRRLDLSDGACTSSLPDKDLDLLGIAPLSPPREVPSDTTGYSISVVPCSFGYWDENQVLFYPNQYYPPPEPMESPCVWWEGMYYDMFSQYPTHDFT